VAAPDEFEVVHPSDAMADSLAAIQAACFPTLASGGLIRAEHYRAHLVVFQEGQHAVVQRATGRVAASSTDFRTRVDFSHYQHRYLDAVADNWLRNHDPEGDWLYGADIGVHPDFRGRGLSTLLYAAEHALVRRLGLRGHVVVALPSGYGAVARTVAVEAYVGAVVRGARHDPPVSTPLRRGYEVYGIIPGYVDDPSCAGYGVFMIWRNPERALAAPGGEA
jgi:GNAT superfamily N-acetyltransferase